MITSFLPEVIEANKKQFISEMESTGRNNARKFLDWLEKTDFYTAPASIRRHMSPKGGLCLHSLNVLSSAKTLNSKFDLKIPEKDIVLPALLHDICKIGIYKAKEVWDKKWKDETNEWRKTQEWVIEDDLPLGHGEKSVMMAMKHLELTDEEMAAIRWHLGAFEAGIHFFYPSGVAFKQAQEKYPLVKLIIIADMISEFKESR